MVLGFVEADIGGFGILIEKANARLWGWQVFFLGFRAAHLDRARQDRPGEHSALPLHREAMVHREQEWPLCNPRLRGHQPHQLFDQRIHSLRRWCWPISPTCPLHASNWQKYSKFRSKLHFRMHLMLTQNFTKSQMGPKLHPFIWQDLSISLNILRKIKAVSFTEKWINTRQMLVT